MIQWFRLASVTRITLLELIHRKILWAIVLLGFALILFSFFLADLSLNEQFRVLAQVGSFSVQSCGLILAFSLGGRLIPLELERQSFQLELSRPLSRGAWLVGKWLGGVLVLVFYSAILAVCLWPFLEILGGNTFQTSRLWLMALFNGTELIVLFSLTLMLSLFVRPAIAIAGGVVFYLACHWQPDLAFYAQKTKSETFLTLKEIFRWVLPPLHQMNLRTEAYLSGSQVSPFSKSQMGFLLVTCLLWCYLYLRAAIQILRGKDLV